MTPATRKRPPNLALLAAALVLLAGALSASAQPVIEITPTVGYRFGGTLHAEDATNLEREADLEDGVSYGLVIDLPVSKHVQIELLADHQSTGLEESTLFAPARNDFDLDVNYYQVGVLGQWPTGRVTPFVVGTIGLASLDPKDSAFSSSQRFSTSFGAGVKLPLSSVVAIRLEGRTFWTYTGDTDWDDDDDCHHHDCDDDWDDDSAGLFQAQLRLGVTLSF